ncbi:MAG TPA: PilZ domain-containing protein [Candidatus Saccharimonadales bacterium]|nr:PilZ domain-containing protein [Candidatus Saccharimonadales bacterium]
MLDARRNFDNAVPAADRREGLRAVPSSLLHASFGSQHGGVVLDLSEGGFAVATALSLLDRVVPQITIALGPGEDKIKVVGLTVWTTEATQRAGFQFIGLAPAERERIRNWVRAHNTDACEVLPPEAGPVLKKVWSANPHLLPLNAIPEQGLAARVGNPQLEHRHPLPAAPARPLAMEMRRSPAHAISLQSGKTIRARLSLSVAAAFVIGSALTFFGAPRWSDRSSAAERPPASGEALQEQNPAQTFPRDAQDKILPQQSEQSVLILPAASSTPYRASLLKEEIPSPASVRIVSQRSLYLPDGVLRDATGKSVAAKSLVPGRLLTEILPEFPASHQDSAAQQDLRIRAQVSESGRVLEVLPISGPTAQMPGILSAVRKWRYEPTLLDDKPVQTQLDLTIQFVSGGQ